MGGAGCCGAGKEIERQVMSDTNKQTIRCFYTCDACGIHRHYVDVPERNAEAMDVVTWINDVAAPALILDHHARSPGCRPKTMTELGIPHSGGEDQPVGTKTRN